MGRGGGAALALIATGLWAGCGTYRPRAHDNTPDAGAPEQSLDAGTVAQTPPCDPADADKGYGGGDWLHTHCNQVLRASGQAWVGRGANLPDTRSCGACVGQQPDVNEVLRRLDLLTDSWGATFVRLDLESYAQGYSRVQWQSLSADSGYLADVQRIVTHAAQKPGVYVLLSPWTDPSLDALGWPTAATRSQLQLLAQVFADQPRVIFGVASAPASNLDGALDAQAWDAMDQAVAAVRATEDMGGKLHHLVAVQGLGGWGRQLDYFLAHPIAAAGGKNVLYEVHVWDPQDVFPTRFENAAKALPVFIGEFGPATDHGSTMGTPDALALIDAADKLGVGWLAWTFHMRCPPNLLVDNSNNGCGSGMTLAPTDWGQLVLGRLRAPPPSGGTP